MKDKIKGCIIAGGFGDACGSAYEGKKEIVTELVPGHFTDDTQLTVAVYESIIREGKILPEKIAENFLTWYQQKKLSGLGSATFQALQGLSVGGHWSLVGRSGEFAAGNGAAMRVAPLAFYCDPENDRELIRDCVFITHKSDEAYCASLAVIYSVYSFLSNAVQPADLVSYVVEKIPDSNTRDKLILLKKENNSVEKSAEKYGCSGYAPESIPLAIYAVTKLAPENYFEVLKEIISCGGDTDTNASIFSQIAGTFLGFEKIKKLLPDDFPEREIFKILR